jgi:hypothetical protein
VRSRYLELRSSSISARRSGEKVGCTDWTLTGTNTGPGGTGKRVRISGYELWKVDDDGLIAESKGNFNSAEYERQQLAPAAGC